MAGKLRERSIDHRGERLPAGIYAVVNGDDTIASYKVRWREEDQDGVARHPSKSFSVRKLGSADRALDAAVAFLREARSIVKVDGSVAKADTAGAMTVEELFREWCVMRGAELSQNYGEKVVRLWDNEIATRNIARVRLDRLSRDPSIIVRFQDSLVAEGMPASKRLEVLKHVRAVLRWGRRRHPNALTIELSGLFELPSNTSKRLAYAADATGLERVIEVVLNRPARDDLLPLRDAALVAAMGFTVAARPSEWLYSAAWQNVHDRSVELQRPGHDLDDDSIGLKTGARAALLLHSASERILAYREALEDRYGPQPDHALVFQVLDDDGPVWEQSPAGEPTPLAWSLNDYKRWTARVWRPARSLAAQAPDAPKGLATMRFYDCRHTVISMALHSTLVMGPHGMNLHNLAGWSGHDVQTLQRYYAHFIARYLGKEPIDLEDECRRARTGVETKPFKPPEKRASPQRAAQRRRRARAASAAEPR